MEKVEIYPTQEWIAGNFESTMSLIGKNLGDCPLGGLIERLGERYATCPASTRKEYYSAFPGGLCYHNLHVLKWINKFASIMMPQVVPTGTMVKLAVLHEIGKVGTLEQEYYVRENSNYYNEKGYYYTYNQKVPYMKVSDRSLYLAQQYGITLTEEEYLSILLYEGHHDEDNDSHKYKEPPLALVLRNASTWARKLESDNVIHWPE